MSFGRTLATLLCCALPLGALGQGSPSDEEKAKAAEIAKKLNNPVASLVSVPLQNNWDFGIGETDATKYTLNVQPVIPFSLSKDWNLITRTIVPIISAQSPVVGGSTSSGLGDITQSFFLSPVAPTKGGWIWGLGPVFLYPTASHDQIGTGKWCAGPTVVLLKQKHGFTVGLLGNQLWSFAGWGARSVNALYLQPILNYTTKTYTTFGVNTEATYDWTGSQWTVPINVFATQMLKVGKQIISVQIGYRYYAEKPDGGPRDGIRAALTFVYPK